MIMFLSAASDWHAHGWFWFVPLAWLLAFLIVALLFLWRGSGTGWRAGRTTDARSILAERYARGEIDHEEYYERLAHLEQR